MFNRDLEFQKKFHFVSLGCSRNLVDSEVMIGILLKNGYEYESDPQKADFLVVNTCGFLEAARKEGIDTIQELFNLKKPSGKIIVAGCMVQKYGDLLKERFPEIHAMIGSGDVEKIFETVSSSEQTIAISTAKSYLEWGEIPRYVTTPKHYAYLKIAEGCKKRCAFCIIPVIKGPLKSKTSVQVLKEFRSLLSQGVKEIILIAQDLGDFGKDRKEVSALGSLLKEMLKEKGDFWIRLLYLYPDEIDEDLIEIIKNDSRICPYLDMPIQHINNEVLKSMHRTTSKEEIISIISSLRKSIPSVAIRTSLMVGFPGETEEQFLELVQFVKEMKLDHVGIFKFSLEKEAYAAKLTPQISEEEKERRYQILAKAQSEVVQERNKEMVGLKVLAFIDGVHPDSEYIFTAHTQRQCPDVDSQIIVNDARKMKDLGALYEIEITGTVGVDLLGKVIKKVGEAKSCNKLAFI